MQNWLKTVKAQTLKTSATGFYYSFNKASLLQTFATMIINQFSRPLNKDAHPERARTFSQMIQYFSLEIIGADDHNRKMVAAEKKLDET